MKAWLIFVVPLAALLIAAWQYLDCIDRGGTPVRGLFTPVKCVEGK